MRNHLRPWFLRILFCLSLLVFGAGCAHTSDRVEQIPSAFTNERLFPDGSMLWKKREPCSTAVAQSGGRPTAVFLGDTVGASPPCDASGPEGYTTDGRPGDKPWQLHMGSSAHKVIANHYQLTHPPLKDIVTNFATVTSIVTTAGGKPALLLPGEQLLKPDITNIRERLVFEIKPSGPDNLTAGQTAVTRYVTAMNRAMPPTDPFARGMGYEGELWVKFAGGAKVWRLVWQTEAPGVVQYRWQRQGVKREDEAKLEALMQAEGEGRWVDLTEKKRLINAYEEAYKQHRWGDLTDDDTQPYAEKLQQAVDTLVANRELILEAQDAVNTPIEAVGAVASTVLSIELSRQMNSITSRLPKGRNPGAVPTPVPALRPAPARLVPSTPAPVPGTRVPPPPPPVAKPPLRKAAKLQTRYMTT